MAGDTASPQACSRQGGELRQQTLRLAFRQTGACSSGVLLDPGLADPVRGAERPIQPAVRPCETPRSGPRRCAPRPGHPTMGDRDRPACAGQHGDPPHHLGQVEPMYIALVRRPRPLLYLWPTGSPAAHAPHRLPDGHTPGCHLSPALPPRRDGRRPEVRGVRSPPGRGLAAGCTGPTGGRMDPG